MNDDSGNQVVISRGKRALLYGLSCLIPIVGIVLGVVYLTKAEAQYKRMGLVCLLAALVFWPSIYGVLFLLVILTGGSAIAPFLYTLF